MGSREGSERREGRGWRSDEKRVSGRETVPNGGNGRHGKEHRRNSRAGRTAQGKEKNDVGSESEHAVDQCVENDPEARVEGELIADNAGTEREEKIDDNQRRDRDKKMLDGGATGVGEVGGVDELAIPLRPGIDAGTNGKTGDGKRRGPYRERVLR